MKHLSRITIIVMLIAVTGGVIPAAATPPTIEKPKVTIDDLSYVTCLDTPVGLEATANFTITPDSARLTNFHMYVEKLGIVNAVDIAYQPTVNAESWTYAWWGGSADPTPDGSYPLTTTDLLGGSWSHHSWMNSTTLSSTPFYEVSVYASADNSRGKGGGNRSTVSADRSWTVDCTDTGTVTPAENTRLVYCWEGDNEGCSDE